MSSAAIVEERGPLLASISSIQADLPRLECRKRSNEDEAQSEHSSKRSKFEQPKLVLAGATEELQLELNRRWLPLLYPLDTKPFEQRGETAGARSSAATTAPPVDARATLALTPSLQKKLEALDQRVKQLYCDSQTGNVEWKSMVRGPGTNQTYYVTVKVPLSPTTAKRAPTHFKVRHANGTLTKGKGWAYLEPLLKQHGDFRQGFCRVTVLPQIWTMNGQAGLTLLATQLVLWRPMADAGLQLDIDALYPDEELLCDELEV